MKLLQHPLIHNPVEAAKLLKAGSKYMLLAILLLLSRGSASLRWKQNKLLIA